MNNSVNKFANWVVLLGLESSGRKSIKELKEDMSLRNPYDIESFEDDEDDED